MAAADHQDAARSAAGARALSTEDVLARSYARIGQGTYSTAALEFASPSSAARQLAEHRWQRSLPGPVTGRPNCSAGSDDFGYCISTVHDAGCGSLATTEIAEGLQAAGAYARTAAAAFRDANGRVWEDQFGRPMNATGHIEAATGQRLGHGAAGFETGVGRRDMITPQRQPRFADPSADPGEDPGQGISYETAAVVAMAREQMGLAGPDAAAVNRERYAERRTAQALNAALSGRGLVPSPDDGESMRERRARIAAERGPASPRQFGGEPLHGSLPQYEAV